MKNLIQISSRNFNERMCGVKLLKAFSSGLRRVLKKLLEKVKTDNQRAYLIDQRFSEMRQKMREKYYFRNGG